MLSNGAAPSQLTVKSTASLTPLLSFVDLATGVHRVIFIILCVDGIPYCHGGCYDIASPEAPALLLRKQESFNDRFSATLEFRPSRKGYEAGITVWWSMYSFASIGITSVLHSGELVPTVICRHPTGAAGKLTTTYPAIASQSAPQAFDASAPARLSAQATPSTYTLELAQGQSKWAFSFNTKDLCIMPPVGGAFTGTMFGIYSFAAWEPVLDPALTPVRRVLPTGRNAHHSWTRTQFP